MHDLNNYYVFASQYISVFRFAFEETDYLKLKHKINNKISYLKLHHCLSLCESTFHQTSNSIKFTKQNYSRRTKLTKLSNMPLLYYYALKTTNLNLLCHSTLCCQLRLVFNLQSARKWPKLRRQYAVEVIFIS